MEMNENKNVSKKVFWLSLCVGLLDFRLICEGIGMPLFIGAYLQSVFS